MKLLITGSSGFLGTHLKNILAARSIEFIAPTRRDFDLLSLDQCLAMMKKYLPSHVVHLAALSGGIGVNRQKPADFYFYNAIINANVFQAAALTGVKRMIFPIGGCSYPASAESPIKEESLWAGLPHEASVAYSATKLLGTVAATAYHTQYGMETQIIIPGNMYGEYDNFSLRDSHVIPALIRKFTEAEDTSQDRVEIWGTGVAIRDFIYAGDVALAIVYFLHCTKTTTPVNLSYGIGISIKSLASEISSICGYRGSILWNASKGDGQLIKIFSTEKMSSLGLHATTRLSEGLTRTIDWYLNTPSKRL